MFSQHCSRYYRSQSQFSFYKIFLARNSSFFNTAPRNKDSWAKALFFPANRHCLKGLAASPKGIQTVHSFVLKSTDVYIPYLFKRKDLVPFGISMIWYHAELKKQTNAFFMAFFYFFMQKTSLNL